MAFIVTSHRAGVPSLFFDEQYAFGLASQPIQVMAHYLWGIECQMPLYYLLLHLWLTILHTLGAGDSEFLLRLPSIFATVFAAMMLYRIGARWWGRLAGVVAALAFVTNPVLLRQTQETRGYALQVLLLCLAWYAFLSAIEAADNGTTKERRRWWIAFAAMLSLAVYAHIDTVVCSLAFPVALAALALAPGSSIGEAGRWRAKARASIRPFLLSALAVGLAAVPIGVDAAIHGGGNAWVPPATFDSLVRIVRDSFLAGVGWAFWPLLALALLALAPTSRRAQLSALIRPFSPLTLAALAWFLVLFLAFTVLPLHLFYSRYMVVIVPPFALLVGIGVSRVQPRLAGILVVLLFIATIAKLPSAYYGTSRNDYRTGATWLNARLQPGDGVVCWPDLYCSVPMSYYIPQLRGDQSTYPGVWVWSERTSQEQLSIALHPTLIYGPPLNNYVATHQRVWLILAPHGTPRDIFDQRRRDVEQQMIAAGFHAVPDGSRIYTPQVTVILYERNP